MSGNQSKSVNKFSPGPWVADRGVVISDGGRWLSSMLWGAVDGPDGYTADECHANCQLMAAAPDLLAAAVALVEMIDTHRRVYGHEKAGYVIDDNEQWRAVRAAIAKARGEG